MPTIQAETFPNTPQPKLGPLTLLLARQQQQQQQQQQCVGDGFSPRRYRVTENIFFINRARTHDEQATAAKDGIEDYHRHKADAQENFRTVARIAVPGKRRRSSLLEGVTALVAPGKSSFARRWFGMGKPKQQRQSNYQKKPQRRAVAGGAAASSGATLPLPPGETEMVPWMDVRVGDLIEIHNRENIPADIVMLSCSDPKGTCFVMTSNLDGETNLKPRVISPDLRAATAPPREPGQGQAQGGDADKAGERTRGVLALAASGAFVECDLPNQKLEHFDGALVVRYRAKSGDFFISNRRAVVFSSRKEVTLRLN